MADARPQIAPADLSEFFTAVGRLVIEADQRQRQLDRRAATRFNVFDLIEPDENKLSDVLADLLDPAGKHGQQDLFLRLFLAELGQDLDPQITTAARIHREATTHHHQKYRRKMDVLVECDTVLLAIENKLDSPEQANQVKDYLDHLQQYAKTRSAKCTLVYLTPNRRKPKSLNSLQLLDHQATGRLKCWSYQVEIRNWLLKCREKCEAPKIQHFLSDLHDYITTTLDRDAEGTDAHETSRT